MQRNVASALCQKWDDARSFVGLCVLDQWDNREVLEGKECEARQGKGISPEKQKDITSGGKLGVGITGMQERIRQFGGTLEIHSGAEGTQIVAKLSAAHIRSEVVA